MSDEPVSVVGELVSPGMTRNLRVKRIYKTGQFENIEFEDEFLNIPENLATNEEFIKSLTKIQLLKLEADISKYWMLREVTRDHTFEEVATMLEDLRAEETTKLNKLISGE